MVYFEYTIVFQIQLFKSERLFLLLKHYCPTKILFLYINYPSVILGLISKPIFFETILMTVFRANDALYTWLLILCFLSEYENWIWKELKWSSLLWRFPFHDFKSELPDDTISP